MSIPASADVRLREIGQAAAYGVASVIEHIFLTVGKRQSYSFPVISNWSFEESGFDKGRLEISESGWDSGSSAHAIIYLTNWCHGVLNYCIQSPQGMCLVNVDETA